MAQNVAWKVARKMTREERMAERAAREAQLSELWTALKLLLDDEDIGDLQRGAEAVHNAFEYVKDCGGLTFKVEPEDVIAVAMTNA